MIAVETFKITISWPISVDIHMCVHIYRYTFYSLWDDQHTCPLPIIYACVQVQIHFFYTIQFHIRFYSVFYDVMLGENKTIKQQNKNNCISLFVFENIVNICFYNLTVNIVIYGNIYIKYINSLNNIHMGISYKYNLFWKAYNYTLSRVYKVCHAVCNTQKEMSDLLQNILYI